MLFLILALVVTGFAFAASWASRRGRAALPLVALCALLAICAAGLLLGTYYKVPSMQRLLVYFLALTGPVILVPTIMLAFRARRGATDRSAFGIALLGAFVGLLLGLMLTVYGLGVW